MSEPFGVALRRHRIASGLSQNRLAVLAGVDPAYVNRLERAGERMRGGKLILESVPRRTVVTGLAHVLGLGSDETDRLLYISGLAPAQDWQARAEKAEAKVEVARAALEPDDEQPTFIRRTG